MCDIYSYGSLNAAFCGAIELETQVCKKRVGSDGDCKIHKKGRGNDDSVVTRKQLCTYCLDNGSSQLCLFCGCRSCFRKSEPSEMISCVECFRRTHAFCITPRPATTQWRCSLCILGKTQKPLIGSDSSQSLSTVMKPGVHVSNAQGSGAGAGDVRTDVSGMIKNENSTSIFPAKPVRKPVSRSSFSSDSHVNTLTDIVSTIDIPMDAIQVGVGSYK